MLGQLRRVSRISGCRCRWLTGRAPEELAGAGLQALGFALLPSCPHTDAPAPGRPHRDAPGAVWRKWAAVTALTDPDDSAAIIWIDPSLQVQVAGQGPTLLELASDHLTRQRTNHMLIARDPVTGLHGCHLDEVESWILDRLAVPSQ